MGKVRTLRFVEDECYGTPCYQQISDEEFGLLFSASDLTECPEDATLHRDLFNADDYMAAVRFGIKLAKSGYEDIELEIMEED